MRVDQTKKLLCLLACWLLADAALADPPQELPIPMPKFGSSYGRKPTTFSPPQDGKNSTQFAPSTSAPPAGQTFSVPSNDLPKSDPKFGQQQGRLNAPPPRGNGTAPIAEHQERDRSQLAESQQARLEQERKHLRQALDPKTRNSTTISRIYKLSSLPWEEYMAVAEMEGDDLGEPSLLYVRLAALKVMNQLSLEKSEPAIPRLVRLLESADLEMTLEQTIVYGMQRFGPKAAAAVPAFIKILESTDPDRAKVQAVVARNLVGMGPTAKLALPALAQKAYVVQDVPFDTSGRSSSYLSPREDRELAARDANVGACVAAYQAMAELTNATPLPVAELRQQGIKALSGQAGLRGFATINEKVLPREEALLLLEQFLLSEPPLVEQVAALKSLGQLGPESPVSAKLLVTKMRAADQFIWQAALGALLQFRPSNPESLKNLVTGLQHPLDRVFVTSCRAMIRFGPEAKAILPDLNFYVQQTNSRTHYDRVGYLLTLIGAIGPEAGHLRPWLVQWLADDSPYLQGRSSRMSEQIQERALLSLGQIGTPVEAVPFILKELALPLKNYSRDSRLATAAHCARNLKSEAPRLVPLLLQKLKSDYSNRALDFHRFPVPYYYYMPFDPSVHTTVTLEVIRTLESIGASQAAEIVPALQVYVDQQKQMLEEYRQTSIEPKSLAGYEANIAAGEQAIRTLSQ